MRDLTSGPHYSLFPERYYVVCGQSIAPWKSLVLWVTAPTLFLFQGRISQHQPLFSLPPSYHLPLSLSDASALNYQADLARYTQMVSSGSFSEISSFMPGIKALLQLAMQLRV